MTDFAAGDRGRIVDALNLDEYLNRPNSLLEMLMAQREEDDVSYSVDRVGDIIAALDAIDQLDVTIEAQSGNAGVISYDADDEIAVRFASGSSATASSKQRRQGQVNKIKNWLDPDNRLERYSLSGRVIRTL